MAADFIGAGWSFPLRTDATGRVALVSHEREIEQSIDIILRTAPGERPMRPEFGCGIHEYVFASADGTTAARISYEVRLALTRWEPRIHVKSVDVVPDGDDRHLLYVDIDYVIKDSNDPRNLVFPFYTIPEE
jgi:phage baseplate assembly protein W